MGIQSEKPLPITPTAARRIVPFGTRAVRHPNVQHPDMPSADSPAAPLRNPLLLVCIDIFFPFFVVSG